MEFGLEKRSSEGLRSALELYATGEEMMRQNLRRSYPGAGEEEVDRLLTEWLRRRPGAEQGDCATR